MNSIIKFIVVGFVLLSCNTGKLDVIASVPISMKEISAIETVAGSDLFWVIEDAGNSNHLFGLDKHGNIMKSIELTNAKNKDWEDLTTDESGAIYIGDFGNNHKSRQRFTIYKVENPENAAPKTTAERIDFNLPKGIPSQNFEAFFIFQDYFYIFSKNNKKALVFKVPNSIGTYEAELVTEFELDSKHSKITSADISADKKKVVLLNHDKLWELTNFTSDNFFEGFVNAIDFHHDSQKEGICFKDNSSYYITDEQNGSEGGNIYYFKPQHLP